MPTVRRGRRVAGCRCGRRRSEQPAADHVRPASAPRAGCSAALGLPTVFVQEGGYVLPTLGPLVLEVLDGFEEDVHG